MENIKNLNIIQFMSGQSQALKGSLERQQTEKLYQQPTLKQIINHHRYEQKVTSLRRITPFAILFLFIIIGANYFFFIKFSQKLKESGLTQEQGKGQLLNASGSQRQVKEKLKHLADSEAKIMSRINQIDIKIDNLKSSIPQEHPNSSPQISKQIQALSNQVKQVKKQILKVNDKIQKESIQSMNQMSELISAVGSKNVQQNDKAKTEGQDENQRSFQADFVIQNDLVEEKFSSKSEVYVQSTHIYSIPKKLWMFKDQGSNYLHELCINNNINFAKDSGYEIIQVNRDNYKIYLPTKTADTVDKILALLSKRALSEKSNLKYHFDGISKIIIMLNLLNQNGGLITNGEFAMSEDLSWLNNITNNPYVNRGNRVIKPQVFGFYSPDYSFEKEKENIKPFKGMEEVDKLITVFPALQSYFISAYKNTEFITKLIKAIYKLLKNPAHFKPQRGHYKLKNLKGEDMYYEYFLIATQVVLQDKQKEIDSAKIDNYRHFAIDYFGLNLINCYYAPYKLKIFWGDAQSHKAFESMTQYTQEELFANIGPMRYIARITPTSEINSYLEDIKKGKRKLIMEGSFIHKLFYSHGKNNFIRPNMQKPFQNKNNSLWDSLPKLIWVFWDKGLQNAGVNNQICVQNLKRMGALSGFKVNQVNLLNIGTFLDESTLKKIQTSLANAKLKTYPQSKSDLYRLALLEKHGGIYMDASYIALQSFDWLLGIGRYPSQYIFNRYGQLPKVFMMWHPHYGAPLQWKINEKYNIKDQWHLAYENNLIVAEKGSELIKEWFQLLLELYVKPFSEVQRIFQECMMYSNKWSTSNWHYLIPMDTIKCVIGRRQVLIQKDKTLKWDSASQYYGLWSMSGYLGQQKFRSNTNFQNPGSEDHLFVYQYSQQYVQGIIGKIRHLVKYYSQHNRQLTIFVSRHMDGNFKSQAHSSSIFMKYMWNSKFELVEKNFYPKLKVLT